MRKTPTALGRPSVGEDALHRTLKTPSTPSSAEATSSSAALSGAFIIPGSKNKKKRVAAPSPPTSSSSSFPTFLQPTLSFTTAPSASQATPSTLTPTRVVCLKRSQGKVVQSCDVYIGRAMYRGGWALPKSVWFNPFSVNVLGREKAIEKFEAYLTQERLDLMQRLHELRGRVLGCWCKKEPGTACHGDVLKRLADAGACRCGPCGVGASADGAGGDEEEA
ncbi:hypothetical protein HDU67_008059 [Dinochytrium kinnereticum]|nr:hypothetical protein HDU67_008059 [Dinochytrium kinnereticum]